jgi:hypothetical protein
MRIAALILGLFGSIWVFFESMLVGSIFHAFGARHESEIIAIGLVIGILGMIASALVIAIPQFSMVMFAGCGLLSYVVALNTDYGNQWVYGSLYLFVAGLAGFGWQEKRSSARMGLVARGPQVGQFATHDTDRPRFCPACGLAIPPGANFCSGCGSAFAGSSSGIPPHHP